MLYSKKEIRCVDKHHQKRRHTCQISSITTTAYSSQKSLLPIPPFRRLSHVHRVASPMDNSDVVVVERLIPMYATSTLFFPGCVIQTYPTSLNSTWHNPFLSRYTMMIERPRNVLTITHGTVRRSPKAKVLMKPTKMAPKN